MKALSKRLNTFDGYIFVKLNRQAAEVARKTGHRVLNLAVGSPDVPPSRKIIAKLQTLVAQKNMHIYPGYGACKEFAQAVRTYYKKRFAVNINADEVYPLLGAKDGIAHLTDVLLDKGDEFLTPNPGYPGFTGSALMLGAKPVYYTLEAKNDFLPDIKKLQKLISEKTKFIFLNFPSNPIGAVAGLKELKKYVAFAKKNNILILYDNAYAEMYYGEQKPPSILEVKGAKNYAVEIHSLSKTFSLAGYRIGFAAGNKKVLAAMAKVKSQVDSGLSLPLQHMAVYALTNPDVKWRRAMLKSYKTRRDILAAVFKKLGLECEIPCAALYIWARVPKGFKNGEKYANYLLQKKQVLVTPGTAFGPAGEKYIRISFCCDVTDLKEYL
jgi:LL-diaminopimelate aminotransferase